MNTAERGMASVMSTALSRLNSFLDPELERLLCLDTEIDAEKFCRKKFKLFVDRQVTVADLRKETGLSSSTFYKTTERRDGNNKCSAENRRLS